MTRCWPCGGGQGRTKALGIVQGVGGQGLGDGKTVETDIVTLYTCVTTRLL